jgi:hypothetical protein
VKVLCYKISVEHFNEREAATAAFNTCQNRRHRLPAALSVSRYWNLEGTGITTDLTFQYTATDVSGNESGYKVHWRLGTNNVPYATTINSAQHTAKVTGISNFSPWGIGNPAAAIAPTAASVSISGRVITPQELGLTKALVTLTDMHGDSKTVLTGKSGTFRFMDVTAGETYILSVQSKRYTYVAQLITVNEDLTELNFAPQ